MKLESTRHTNTANIIPTCAKPLVSKLYILVTRLLVFVLQSFPFTFQSVFSATKVLKMEGEVLLLLVSCKMSASFFLLSMLSRIQKAYDFM